MLSVVLLDWFLVSETSNEHKKHLCTGHNLLVFQRVVTQWNESKATESVNTDAYFEAKGVTQKPEKQERETLFHFGVVKSLEPDKCFERRLLAFPRECPESVANNFVPRALSSFFPLEKEREGTENRVG